MSEEERSWDVKGICDKICESREGKDLDRCSGSRY